MKILFAGTPAIAVPTLKALAENHQVFGVLTNPDRPAGRKNILTPSPVKVCALELAIPVFQPEKLDEKFISYIKAEGFDTLITFAFGKIFKKDFLDIFSNGAFNIHPSLLPRWRGPAPINAAILAGDKVTGITIQKMALKMDTGDIALQIPFPLDGSETAPELTEFVALKSAELIPGFIMALESDSLNYTQQNEAKATYCPMLKKEDGIIDWHESAAAIEREIRAYQPWPGCFTTMSGKTIAITQASIYTGEEFKAGECGTVLGVDRRQGIVVATGKECLAIQYLKPQAKNEMDAKSFLNGARNVIGTVLGEKNE
ncbi:MAG: methionyl-tRNA formyltransferase [Spirochaetia bacterium]|nr:methionyl-tRNA formyltransferase [Spirochaetia bacterium]